MFLRHFQQKNSFKDLSIKKIKLPTVDYIKYFDLNLRQKSKT